MPIIQLPPVYLVTAVLCGILLLGWITAGAPRVASPAERWRRDEAFRDKVRDLELDYQYKHDALRRHTAWLAFLGYGIIFTVIALLITLGFLVAVVSVDLTKSPYAAVAGALPLWFAYQLLTPLRLPTHGDSGVRMTRKNAPRLFKLLDKVRKKANGPAFTRVFINMEMNASVSRHSGFFGFFGFGDVTLTLGLPLMQALNTSQIAAVIAHEYGHVAAHDNALGQWIYRIRYSWLNMASRLGSARIWRALRLDRFYKWFVDIFNAYAFTLSRGCEYEADAFAAKITGAHNVAGALTAMTVRGTLLQQRFWDPLWDKAKTIPAPTGTPYRSIPTFFKMPHEIGAIFTAAIKTETKNDSTHPALKDRLSALGTYPQPLTPIGIGSATDLLGKNREATLASLFDTVWKRISQNDWHKKYKDHQTALATVAAFDGRRLQNVSRENLFTLITAATAVGQENRVIDACRELARREPDNTSAEAHLIGLQLVHNRDENLLFKLDEHARLHPDTLPTASRFALRYLEGEGRMTEAAVHRYRLEDWEYKKRAAEDERATLTPADIFMPHLLRAAYLHEIVKAIKAQAPVTRAWMVRKHVNYLPEEPLFIIGLKPDIMTGTKARKATLAKINHTLNALHFPPYFRFYWVSETSGLERKLKRVKNSEIYRK